MNCSNVPKLAPLPHYHRFEHCALSLERRSQVRISQVSPDKPVFEWTEMSSIGTGVRITMTGPILVPHAFSELLLRSEFEVLSVRARRTNIMNRHFRTIRTGSWLLDPHPDFLAIFQYDLSASQFSPDGRVFQVEYAQKAVENSGTVIGLRCSNGVVLAVEKLVTSKLYEPGANKRIFNIDRHIGMVSNLMNGPPFWCLMLTSYWADNLKKKGKDSFSCKQKKKRMIL